MPLSQKKKLRSILKWILWVFLVQLVLANISAALYAYKFTHLCTGPVPDTRPSQNIFTQTWKLFVGPKIYKLNEEWEPSFAYRQVTLKTSKNISIDAWYSSSDSAKGCVIFFHGITANKAFLVHEAARFKQWGYNILLVDLRAHGKSGGAVTSFGVKETEEVQKAFAFAKEKGNNKIILYGVSMGAVVIIKAVAENKVQPAAIIADMPFASLQDHLKARARVLGFPSEPFAFLVTMWIGFERGYNGFNNNVVLYAKQVKCPVLLQWGERDRYVTKNETEKIYNSLGSLHKKLIIYPGADHQSFLMIDPQTWEKEVGDFINALPG